MILLLYCCATLGQSPQPAPAPAKAATRTPSPSHLFDASTPLALQLEADLRALKGDRGTERKDHPGLLRFGSGGGGADTGSVPVKLRTRGIYRLKNCGFPPIRLDLPSHKVEGTPFAGEDRLKLVTHCQSDRTYERNLLKEYALYRVFNAVTDTSYRVRLAHMTYVDSARHDTVSRYGFLVESDAALARRIASNPLNADNLYDPVMDPSYMTLVAVYQYLIGNNDWSVWKRHNMAIFQRQADPKPVIAVPYDYDFSGAVNAPYAVPPPQLNLQSVRQRVYRGFCQPDTILNAALARFRAAKDSIYAAVRAVPDLPERDARGVLEYFDQFYQVLGNPGMVNREFVRACRPIPR
ncbi:MAG TPA: hypothetical protein VMR92_00125 [Gemmatimonadales bacterium]|nr:hypothetical protein [Gemmatimonadales bacterium]